MYVYGLSAQERQAEMERGVPGLRHRESENGFQTGGEAFAESVLLSQLTPRTLASGVALAKV